MKSAGGKVQPHLASAHRWFDYITRFTAATSSKGDVDGQVSRPRSIEVARGYGESRWQHCTRALTTSPCTASVRSSRYSRPLAVDDCIMALPAHMSACCTGVSCRWSLVGKVDESSKAITHPVNHTSGHHSPVAPVAARGTGGRAPGLAAAAPRLEAQLWERREAQRTQPIIGERQQEDMVGS